MKLIFLLLLVLFVIACKKSSQQTTTIGDEVIGTYTGLYNREQTSVQVYKNGNQYSMRKISSASFPEFTFQYRLGLFGILNYAVPSQGSIISDSSYASYVKDYKEFSFTIKENNGNKWQYSGYK